MNKYNHFSIKTLKQLDYQSVNIWLKFYKVYPCTVEKIQTDKQGLQTGLKVSNSNLKSWIYIPKYNATYSRFLDLTQKYSIGDVLNVVVEKYSSLSSSFIGSIENLPNPWDDDAIQQMQIGDTISILIKQINEFTIIGELSEGVECWLVKQEISWDIKECITSQFSIEEEIEVCVTSINHERKRIDVSIKRLSKTPELEYFEKNANQIVEVEVAYIVPDKGIAVKYIDNDNTGFIWWSEISWGIIGNFENLFNKKDTIRVIPITFDAERNNVRFSIKRQFEHQFDDWYKNVDENQAVKGQIIGYFENSVHVELTDGEYIVQAFILKREISNFAFIDSEDLKFYLPVGDTFNFFISEINKNKKTVALTRKEYLEQSIYPNYGEKIDVKYVKETHSKRYFYSDEIEGWTNLPDKNIEVGAMIEVTLISASLGEFTICE